ncbi:phosphohydrolase, partial [Vibrio anguillarum]|nr:phosphohydrolase [Vibrio anguillarum]
MPDAMPSSPNIYKTIFCVSLITCSLFCI